MKWKVKAAALVDDGVCTWEVDADSADEAFIKGMIQARENDAIDDGTVEVEPLEEDKQLICTRLMETLQLMRTL